MKISVTIITYNEEHHIQDCIRSVDAIADEIVVVDSFSTDSTADLCKSMSKVKFFTHAFKGHVQQKNYAIEVAANQWILSLDADERLSPELAKKIYSLKSSEKSSILAYSMPRLNNFCGKWIRHGGWYPDVKVRLWHRDFGSWGGNNPHDKVVMTKEAPIAQLEDTILHYSFDSIVQHINQINKFSSIAAEALFQQSDKRNVWFNILLGPPFTFIKKYIFQLGFLDGFYGFVIAKNSAHAKFLKYVKYHHLKTKK